jgi:hypothetical protein
MPWDEADRLSSKSTALEPVCRRLHGVHLTLNRNRSHEMAQIPTLSVARLLQIVFDAVFVLFSGSL